MSWKQQNWSCKKTVQSNIITNINTLSQRVGKKADTEKEKQRKRKRTQEKDKKKRNKETRQTAKKGIGSY